MSEAEEWSASQRQECESVPLACLMVKQVNTAYLYAGGYKTEGLHVLSSLCLPVTCVFLLVGMPGHSWSLETVQERKATITHVNLHIYHKTIHT